MLWLLLIGCNWWSSDPKPVDSPPDVVPPPILPVGPSLPPPPRLGVGEGAVPATLILPAEIREQSGPATVDVWFDPDRTTFEALGVQLDAWGLTRVDGDGEVWRVRAVDAPYLAARLASAEGVRQARDAVTREPLPNGLLRDGAATYAGVTWTFSQKDGPGKGAFTEGAAVAEPVLPKGLPAGALHCFAPLLDELRAGEVRGPGWVRALSTEPRAWAVVTDGYGACAASGWVALTASAPVSGLRFGERAVGEADDSWFADLAVKWLAAPRNADDPQLLQAVELLATASDAALARAVRDSAAGPAQSQLFQALTARDPEAATAVAAGAASPLLHAQAVGQDEVLRAAALRDPKAPTADVYAALAGWRPGPTDPPDLLERLLVSPDPRVRQKAQEARIASSSGACVARKPGALDQEAAARMYAECPQPSVRIGALARLRSLDNAAADGLLAKTLEAPETVAAGVAAVRAAQAAGRTDLLVALVGRQTVNRAIRREALSTLVRAGAPGAQALVEKHGAFLGYRPIGGVPTAATDHPAPAGGTR